MKKLVLKNWVEKMVQTLFVISLMLIICSADSEWSKEYFIFLIINILVFVISAKILKKYSKTIDKQ